MCHHLFVTYGGYFDQFFYSTGEHESPLYSKLTLHAIDLLRYESFAQYRQELGKRSSFFLRDARRAGKMGYVIQEFNANEFLKDIASIHASMKVRSFGPVWQNWLQQNDDDQSSFKRLPHNSTHCPVHWERFIGVFAHSPNAIQGDLTAARLVGYARLQRVGNCIAYEDLIGHRNFMADGIMKLLHCHILHWLIDSEDEDVKGLEYVVHGSIERGNDGIFFWKKKALFMPYLLELVATELPEDFIEEEYLRLNPDVKASGLDAATHYRLYGQKEGRHYHLNQHHQHDQESDDRDQSNPDGDIKDHQEAQDSSNQEGAEASAEQMSGDTQASAAVHAVDQEMAHSHADSAPPENQKPI